MSQTPSPADQHVETGQPGDGSADGSAELPSFGELGVAADIVEVLTEGGVTAPFPIQAQTLPVAASGADVIGQARTGTGKTLAFAIPLATAADPQASKPQGLVVVPTRELCLQVTDEVARVAGARNTSVVAIYGGREIEGQAKALAEGAPLVVGTPGRLLDLVGRGHLDLSGVTQLVLDEADEMLDLGFLEDVEKIIDACATERQTLLFSATMPGPVVSLGRRYMNKPTFVRAEVEEPRLPPTMSHVFLSCHRMDKPAVLARILAAPDMGRCLVFTSTKRMADTLVKELAGHDYNAAAIHSDRSQVAREKTLEDFRAGRVGVLVATEVAARGLDIPEVTHVVNFDAPDDEKMYLHRVGRTSRAGAAGMAVTLAIWNELARVEVIKKGLEVEAETHEVFSTSPLLTELFNLSDAQATREAASGASDEASTSAEATANTAVSTSDETSTSDKAGTDAEAGEAGSQSRTTRRRSRSRTRTKVRHDGSAAGDQPADGAEREADSGQPRAAQSEGDASGGEQAVPASAASTEDGQADRQRQPAKAQQGEQAKRASSQRRRGGRRKSGGASRRPQTDAATLRGEGKPARTRPLTATHLP